MTDQSNFPIEEKIRAAAQAVEPRSEFSEALWRQIAEKPARPANRYPALRLTNRPLWIAAISVLGVALVIGAFGPQNVAAAFRSLMGYLPGIGFVQNEEGTLYLAKPVTAEQEGVSVVVEQAAADANKVVVAYHVEGLPEIKPGETMVCFYDGNKLRLPDGKTRMPTGGSVVGSQARVEFQPLPKGVKSVTLLVSQMFPDPACTAPAELKVDLDFSPKPPEVTLMPVIENIQATPEGSAPVDAPSEAAPVSQAASKVEDASGIGFAIDRSVELPDGYLIAGRTVWKDAGWENVSPVFEGIKAFDANGKAVQIAPSFETTDNEFTFTVKGKDFQGPLTFEFQAVTVWVIFDDGPGFSFDAGPNPQIGQSWRLDQELDVAGNKVMIQTIQVVHISDDGGDTSPTSSAENATANGFAIEMKTEPAITNLSLKYIEDREAVNGILGRGYGQQDRFKPNASWIKEIFFPDGLPTGKVTLQVHDMHLQINGSWQVEWQPPTTPE